VAATAPAMAMINGSTFFMAQFRLALNFRASPKNIGDPLLRTSLAPKKRILKRSLNFLAAILVLCLVLPGCSWMSKSGRQQMAYRNYVRKHIRERQHQIARAQAKANRDMKAKMKSLPPSKEEIDASVEPVAEPVMVSASETGNTQAEP
jgi:MFS-type transporter involved in bile tolerance (Atg22 family)